MGRPERALDPDAGPVQRFALELRKLRREAGQPGYRELSRRAHYSVTALSEAAGGEALPTLEVALAYAQACGGDRKVWKDRWRVAASELGLLPTAGPSQDGPAPYLGLATFEPEDAPRFFGRHWLIEELCGRLASHSLLAVFGASGSGKSSLLRAGVLPALQAGEASGAAKWRPVLFTPGGRPLEELAFQVANLTGVPAIPLHVALTGERSGARLAVRQALAAVPSQTDRVLIVVDQFEEVFTLCSDARERSRFLDCLLAATDSPRRHVRVVLGIRADFYSRCAEYPPLVAALRDRQVLVGPMDEADLRQVISQPAVQAGLSVEPSLVETILAEADGQPGVLPLVSHALLETWNRRVSGTLTLTGYREAGGVREAVAQTAEHIHERLGSRDRRLLREIFLRLTTLGEGTEDTRRRVRRAELLGLAGDRDGQAVELLLTELTAARLVTADEDGVTVTHEALIRGWPRLRGWLSEDRALLRAYRRLTEAAAEWDHQGRDDGFLFVGPQLDAWDDRPLDRLNDREHAFLSAARRQRARQRAARRRRMGVVLTGLVALAVAMTVLASLAVVQTGRAREERSAAFSRQLAATARAQLELDPELALLLAREAYRVKPTAEAEAAVRQAAADSRIRSTIPPVHGGKSCGASFSPDGRHLATSGADGTVRVWTLPPHDGAPANPVTSRGHQGEAWSPVFSPDGQLVASGGIDGTVRIWRWQDLGPTLVLRGHTAAVWSVAFSPDGHRIASASDDGAVRVWNTTGRGPVAVLRQPGRALGAAFSPDGRRLAVGVSDGTVRIRNADGHGKAVVLRGHDSSVEGVAFSPDGRRVASASTDGTVRVRRADGTGEPMVLRGHAGTAEGVAFSPDGRRVASTGNDGSVRVWNADSNAGPLILRGHRGTAWTAAFSPGGTRVASAGDDGTIRLWDVTGTGDPIVLPGSRGAVWSVAFSPGADRLVTGGSDGTVHVWPTGGGKPLFTGQGHDGDVSGVAFAPDGRHVASAGADSTVRLWDVTGSARPVVLRGHDEPVWAVAFSPDSALLASAGSDGTVRLWDVTGTWKPVVLRPRQGAVRSLAFSPDGRHLVSTGTDGTARLWDTASLSKPQVLRGHLDLVWSAAFSQDGRQLATAGNDGTVRIWDMTGQARDEPLVLHGHQGLVWSVAYGPGPGQWTSSGNDGTLRIWDPARTREPITFRGFGASVEGIDASPGTQRLATAHDDGTARTWRCEACGPIDQVLRLAQQHTTRELTTEEQALYLQNQT
jgi:WD40 repeat protein